MVWILHLFCILEGIWILVSWGFLGLAPNVSCYFLKNEICNPGEASTMFFVGYTFFYWWLPYTTMVCQVHDNTSSTISNTNDNNNHNSAVTTTNEMKQGLFALGFVNVLLQLGAICFIVNTSFTNGSINPTLVKMEYFIHWIMLGLLGYGSLSLQSTLPKPLSSSMYEIFCVNFSSCKGYCIFRAVIVFYYMFTTIEVGDYDAEGDITSDMITSYFINMTGFYGIASMQAILWFTYSVVCGGEKYQFVSTATTLIIITYVVIVFYSKVLPILSFPPDVLLAVKITQASFVILGLAALYVNYRNRHGGSVHGYTAIPSTSNVV